MSQGQNKSIAVSVAASAIPGLIQDVENIFSHGQNDAKHQAVVDGAVVIATAGSAMVGAANPAYAALASYFSKLIVGFITSRKQAGTPVAPEPLPAPQPIAA